MKQDNIVTLFLNQVKQNPNKIAVIERNRKLSYSELNKKANQVASLIRERYQKKYNSEIGPDTLIGLCLERGIDAIIGILGILKVGAAYVPIDHNYPEERIKFMLNDINATIILTQKNILEKTSCLQDKRFTAICLDQEEFTNQSEQKLPHRNKLNDLAYVIYTSGSTGNPKGVLIEHLGVIRLVKDTNYILINKKDRVAHASSISFDAATLEIWGALLNGATLVCIDLETFLNIELFAEFLTAQKISVLWLTAALFEQYALEDPSIFEKLKYLLAGGDVLNPHAVNNILTCPQGKPNHFLNGYGPTENTTFTTTFEIDKPIEPGASVPIGKFISGTIGYILDTNLTPVSPGEVGELYVGGKGLARGYLNQPELTAKKFVTNSFIKKKVVDKNIDTRLYKTGDLVRCLPDGNLEFIGRVDNQIKLRGFRIELGEIESALNSIGNIDQGVVILSKLGQQKTLIAYYKAKKELPAEIIKQALSQYLPNYMIPSFFIRLYKFPITVQGKIDRKALLAIDQEKLILGTSEDLPQTDIEKDLISICSKIFNIKQINVNSNIFDLGAHSLIVAQIITQIQKVLGLTVEAKDVFNHPEIKDLAAYIEQKEQQNTGLLSIPKASRSQRIPLTFQQEQIWFLSKLVSNNKAYNFQFTLRLKGELNINILNKCLNEIVRRHEILRTTFDEENGIPFQIVHAAWEACIQEIDLTYMPLEKREKEAEKLILEELQQGFDFSQLPLIKWRLYRLTEKEYIYLQIEHHFIHDGWAVSVFLKELQSLYSSYVEGHKNPLKKLSIQYADYAIWQRKVFTDELIDKKINSLINKINNYPQSLNLITDYPRSDIQGFNGDAIRLDLDYNLYQKLREFSRANNVTLFMTMYAAFAILLHKYTGQEKMLIGSGAANRPTRELEKLMGMFVNTMLLYVDVTGNPTSKELLEKIKSIVLAALEYQGVPFVSIVRKLHPSITVGKNPLFQVMFAFHDAPVPITNFADLEGTLIERHNKTAKHDINLICIPRAEQHIAYDDTVFTKDHLTLVWEYNTDLFKRSTMLQMIKHYIVVLSSLVENPITTNISKIAILSPEEEKQLLYEFYSGLMNLDQ